MGSGGGSDGHGGVLVDDYKNIGRAELDSGRGENRTIESMLLINI